MVDQRLNDENFHLKDDTGEYQSMYLEDIDDLVNNRGVQNNDGAIPTVEEYGNMIQPERIDTEEVEEAIDKYLTVEINIGCWNK